MSFDIYGNNLKRGHCEVHHHVEEEYPCSQCVMESQHREVAQSSKNEACKLLDENDHLNDKIDELEKRLSIAETMGDKAQAKRDLEQQRKGFWLGFEDARCHPDEMNILKQWENTKVFIEAKGGAK
jgi:microsomal dipeptidase-like Zn-dependent dipeptidase